MPKLQSSNSNIRKIDRRKNPTPIFSKYTFRGRRSYMRRAVDRYQSYYVDKYGRKSIAAFFIIVILCGLDAQITLQIIEYGGIEINPFMNYIISMGTTSFFCVKYGITGICLLLLISHKNYYLFNGLLNVKNLVIIILILYVFLVLYELYILRSI